MNIFNFFLLIPTYQVSIINNSPQYKVAVVYRTFDDIIDGLVITFINLSALKQVEVKLHGRADE